MSRPQPCRAKLKSWSSPGGEIHRVLIAFGVGLIAILLVLYIGWILLNWRHGLLLVLGVLLVLMIICGILLNTIFLVREIRRNEQHDAFINAVTHELKTPVASIRLYLETLQTRPVDEAKRNEFYRIMLDDSDRLLSTIEQVLRTGRVGATAPPPQPHPHRSRRSRARRVERVRTLHRVSPEALRYQSVRSGHSDRRPGRNARGGHESHRQCHEVFGPDVQRDGGDGRPDDAIHRSG